MLCSIQFSREPPPTRILDAAAPPEPTAPKIQPAPNSLWTNNTPMAPCRCAFAGKGPPPAPEVPRKAGCALCTPTRKDRPPPSLPRSIARAESSPAKAPRSAGPPRFWNPQPSSMPPAPFQGPWRQGRRRPAALPIPRKLAPPWRFSIACLAPIPSFAFAASSFPFFSPARGHFKTSAMSSTTAFAKFAFGHGAD